MIKKEDKSMEYANTMQDLIEKILRLADMGESNMKAGDVWRTRSCTSEAHGMAAVLGLLGIDYDFGTYMDDDYYRIGYFSVDGVVLIKNGWINWKAYADAVLDKVHHWNSKMLTVVD